MATVVLATVNRWAYTLMIIITSVLDVIQPATSVLDLTVSSASNALRDSYRLMSILAILHATLKTHISSTIDANVGILLFHAVYSMQQELQILHWTLKNRMH